MKYSIGIDIGTTTVKCILFGEGAKVVAEAGNMAHFFQSLHGRSRILKTGGTAQWNLYKPFLQRVG